MVRKRFSRLFYFFLKIFLFKIAGLHELPATSSTGNSCIWAEAINVIAGTRCVKKCAANGTDSADIGWQRNRKVGASEEAPTLSLGGKLPWAYADTSTREAAAAFEPRVRSTERPENISVASPEPTTGNMRKRGNLFKFWFNIHYAPQTICGIYCITQLCMNFQKFLNQKYVIPVLPKGKDATY